MNNELDIPRYFVYRRRKEENDDAMNLLTQIYLDTQDQKKRKFEALNSGRSKMSRFKYRTVKNYLYRTITIQQ